MRSYISRIKCNLQSFHICIHHRNMISSMQTRRQHLEATSFLHSCISQIMWNSRNSTSKHGSSFWWFFKRVTKIGLILEGDGKLEMWRSGYLWNGIMDLVCWDGYIRVLYFFYHILIYLYCCYRLSFEKVIFVWILIRDD